MLAAFVLDDIPVNAPFQSRPLSNDKVTKHPELWFAGGISPHGGSSLLQIEAQLMRLIPCPVYSPDMSPIDHVWYLVGRCLARDICHAASKDELLLRIQAIRNYLPQSLILNLLDFMPRRIAALFSVRGGYTQY
ncbi:transposable element Tcb2 transposase [Trichonephila clavipes]|nr:transposable element Tcb2 transposase [Trichonephila clavipes]